MDKTFSGGDDCFTSIWRPSVRPTNTSLPRPKGSSERLCDRNDLYIKTSLAHETDEIRKTQTLNRKIIKSSQSFNSTPKPFKRQEALNLEIPLATLRSHQLAKSQTEENSFNRPLHLQSDETMAQKLVHKQYNSPIDLYSMNNIRKTIEAHSELIAPGVKAINFNKLEGSINKQSEVYKLVKEEEEKRHQAANKDISFSVEQQPVSSLSPVPNRQLIANPNCAPQPVYYPNGNNSSPRLDGTQYDQRDMANYERVCHDIRKLGRPTGQDVGQVQQDSRPKCRECGIFIVGPFAKLQNRCIHPHCFNCTTCGTSLKNSGYFVISDKLYCDIHAKQVANLMKVNYNFDANKQSYEQTTNNFASQLKETSHFNNNSTTKPSLEQQQTTNQQMNQKSNRETLGQLSARSGIKFRSAYTVNTQTNRPFYSTIRDGFDNRPNPTCTNQATISTMFSKKGENNDLDRREARWTWKPTTSCGTELGTERASFHSNSISGVHSSTMRKVTDLEDNSDYNNMRQLNDCRKQTVEWQTTIRQDVGGADRCIDLQQSQQIGKTPVCNRCRLDIQGPYILAGETVWCKPCSQRHFICCTCNLSLLNVGFIETGSQKYYCEHCFEKYSTPNCSKCNMKVRGYCLNALGRQWHPDCFVCGHCRQPFRDSSFYLEDDVPYCQNDWNLLFTTKCHECTRPIGAGDRWIQALDRNYHADCFRCTNCRTKLEGSTFYCRSGKPFCKSHARTCL